MSERSEVSLRQLQYFAALAEELHFGKAASRLGISQPALTRQIQSLEKFVGAELVERSQRSVALTAAGMAFANGARETLEQHNRSVEAARNVATRQVESLAIGFESCAPFHDFSTVLKQFLSRHPRTRVSSFQMSGPDQAEALVRHRIDLGFMHPPIPDSELLTFESVAEERFIVALPASHQLASKKRVLTADLAKENFILFPRGLAPGCYDAIQRICQAGGFEPRVVHESNDVSVSLNLIPALGALTLFPECVSKKAAAGVVFRDLDGTITTVTCGFLRRSGNAAVPVSRFLRTWRAVKKSAA